MNSWIVRCRYMGEAPVWNHFFQSQVAALSWDTGVTNALNQSLLNYPSPVDLTTAIQEAYPQYPEQWELWTTILWQFSHEIKEDDYIVTNPTPMNGPNRARPRLGRCFKSYYYEKQALPWGTWRPRSENWNFYFRHRVGVHWLRDPIPHIDPLPYRLDRKLQTRSKRWSNPTVEGISEFTPKLESLFERLSRR